MGAMITELVVLDVNKSVEFYLEYLECRINQKIESEDHLDWAELVTPKGVKFQLIKKTEFDKEVSIFKDGELGGTVVLIFEVEEIENFWNKFKDGPEIVEAIKTKEYGAIEFKLKDPDGYLIQISQRIS